jgi:hypothetical protein
MREPFRAAAAIMGAAGIALSFLYGAESRNPDTAQRIVRFLSFFTIQANLLALLAMLVPVLAPRSRTGSIFASPPLRGAILGYLVVVALVYHFLLRGARHLQGPGLAASSILHYVSPLMFALDWLLFVPKGRVAWRKAFVCLVYPAVYLVWTLGHGALGGWYPYSFLDAVRLGYPAVLLNVAGISAAFLLLELLLIALDRNLASR